MPKKTYLLYAFFLGNGIGILVTNFILVKHMDMLQSEFLMVKRNIPFAESMQLLRYIFIQRFRDVLILYCLSFTKVRDYAYRIYCVYLGYVMGTMGSCFILLYGVKGIWLYALSIFPHYLLYLLLLFYVLGYEMEYRKKQLKMVLVLTAGSLLVSVIETLNYIIVWGR